MVSIIVKKKNFQLKQTIKFLKIKSYSKVFARLVNRLWITKPKESEKNNKNNESLLDFQEDLNPKFNSFLIKKSRVIVQTRNVINYLLKQRLKNKKTFNFAKKFGVNVRNFTALQDVCVLKHKSVVGVVNEETLLYRNVRIDNIFFCNEKQDFNRTKNSLNIKKSPLSLTGSFFNIFLKKNFILKELKVHKMFFYFLKEKLYIINNFLSFIWTNEILKLFLHINKRGVYFYLEIFSSMFINIISSVFNKEKFIIQTGNVLSMFSFNTILLKQLFLLKFSILDLNKNLLIVRSFGKLHNIIGNFSKTYFIKDLVKYSIFSVYVFKYRNNFKLFKESFMKHVNKFKLKIFFEQDYNPNFSAFVFKKFLKTKLLRNKKNVKLTIWKKGGLTYSRYLLSSKFKKGVFFTNHKYTSREISSNILFLTKRLEEKMYQIKDKRKKENLEKLRNYFLNFWKLKEKNESGLSYFISNIRNIRKIKNRLKINWLKILQFIFLKWLRENKNEFEIKPLKFGFLFKFYRKFFNITFYKKTSTVGSVKTIKKSQKAGFIKKRLKKWKRKRLLKVRNLFKTKRLIKKENYLPLKRQKDLLSFILNKNVSIFYLNALSLSRFAFSQENARKNSNLFLQNIVREMVNRFKYVAIYIKDLVYISFISLFLKKLTFLASFIAFQIEKLPKNRKETKFIKFIIKVVRVSSARRKEITGLRIKFKGRVNRWRRTKSIVGERGILRYYTYDSRIEYGTAKAITRKGALGIRIWLSYNPIFKNELLNSIVEYRKYSAFLRSVALNRYYNNFVLKNITAKKLINS